MSAFETPMTMCMSMPEPGLIGVCTEPGLNF